MQPLLWWLTLIPLGLSGCSEQNRQPTLDPIAPVTVIVGQTLTLPITARDPDGDPIRVSVSPLPLTASMETIDGIVHFVWAPLVSDTGPSGRVHDLTFAVDDGRGGRATRTVSILVSPQLGSPVFLGPKGYVLNLSEDDDISFTVEVKDDDSSEVALRVLSQPIEGAKFIQLDGKRASFYWRPSEEQRDNANYWQLTIGAKDETHPEVQGEFSILLMNATEGKDCNGQPPRLDSCTEPACAPLQDLDDSSVIVTRIDAFDVESEVRNVTLHYALNNPLDPNSFSGNELPLWPCNPSIDTGCPQDEKERYFIGTLPNPVVASTEPLFFHYYFTGRDNDDPRGSFCDRTGRLPKAGHYTLVNYPVGWTGGCRDDAMEPNDTVFSAHMLELGVTLDLRWCLGQGGADWYRSEVEPGSVFSAELIHEPSHGALALSFHDEEGRIIYPLPPDQPSDVAAFVPTTSPVYIRVKTPDGEKGGDLTYGLVLSSTDGACPNDSFEPNDVPDESTLVASGQRDVVICPGDRDMFSIVAQAGQSVLVDLSFDHAFGDLDLALYTSDGDLLGRSDTASNGETITVHFLEGATLLLEVSGFRGASNAGVLDIQIVPTATVCFEDGFSPNHNPGQSILLPENGYSDLLICADKEDWYRVDVNAGETLTVVAYPESPLDSQLELVMVSDAQGTQVIGSPFGLDDDPFVVGWEATAAAAGALRWRLTTKGEVTTFYTMAFSVEDPPGACQDDRFSPTNSPNSALDINSDDGFVTRLKICPGGEDWYRIQGGAFEELFVYVFGFSNEALLNAELYRYEGSDLVKLADGLSASDGVELRYLPEENIEFYIRVLGQPGEIHHYDLVMGLE